MSGSRELKDFVSGFSSGWKLVEDSQYKKALSDYYSKGGRNGSKSGEPTDEELSKYAPELAPKKSGLFGNLFGGGDETPKPEGAEKGQLRANSMIELYRERGDAAKAVEATKNAAALSAFNKGMDGKSKANGDLASAKAKPISFNSEDGTPAGTFRAPDTGETYTPPSEAINTSTPDEEDQTDEFARGGMVPTRYAVVGGPISSGAAIPDQPVAPAAQDDEEDTTQGNSDSEYNSPEYRARLKDASMAGLTLAMNNIRDDLGQSPAVPNSDPSYKAKIKGLAMNEGKADDEDINALNAKINPNGQLPRELLAPSRLAAVMSESKDPEEAKALVTKLVLHDKEKSQVLGSLALNAIKQGDYEAAAKMIEHAYNDYDYDGKRMMAVYNGDGTFTSKTAEGDEQSSEQKADIPQVTKIAADLSNGTGYLQRALQGVGSYKQFTDSMSGKKSSESTATTADYMKVRSSLKDAKAEELYFSDKLDEAKKSGKKSDTETAQTAYDAARSKLNAAQENYLQYNIATRGKKEKLSDIEAKTNKNIKSIFETATPAAPAKPKEEQTTPPAPTAQKQAVPETPKATLPPPTPMPPKRPAELGSVSQTPAAPQFREGQTATGPNGQKAIFKGGKWYTMPSEPIELSGD